MRCAIVDGFSDSVVEEMFFVGTANQKYQEYLVISEWRSVFEHSLGKEAHQRRW